MGVTVAATKRSSALIFPVTAILIAPATRLPPLTWMRMILNRSVDGSGGGSPPAASGVAGWGAPLLHRLLLLDEGNGWGVSIFPCCPQRSILFFAPAPRLLCSPHRLS